MAYAAVVTIKRLGSDVQVTIAETDCAIGDEATISGLPLHGTILRQTCVLSSGTATTVSPLLAQTAAGTGTAVLVENATPAAVVDNASPTVAYVDADGIAFHQARPDAGADNVISTQYLIKGAW